MKKNVLPAILLLIGALMTGLNVGAQSITITSPANGAEFEVPAVVNFTAEAEGLIPGEPAHLKVVNNQPGYRKLKLGNNPDILYSPSVNVIGPGNDKVEITLKDFSGNAQWSKIRFRPTAKGSLNLSSYIAQVGGNANDWTTITIPLADFDEAIDFTMINYIEFPYSADADPFDLGISEIKFTGSTMPYTWFGQNKNDNIHDGFNGPGQLFAIVDLGNETISNVEKVTFIINGEPIGEDNDYPFSFLHEFQQADNYSITAEALYWDGTTSQSAPVALLLNAPPETTPGITISSPNENQVLEAPADLIVNAIVSGVEPKPKPYLHVTNDLSGYRKLKFGYNAGSIYGPTVNPIAAGNDTLEIFLSDQQGNANWSKIRIRPSATGSLNLQEYVAAAGGVGPEGKLIKIPLSDFDPSIDFSAIAFFEFPYSANAGFFDLKIYSVTFTGGQQEFVWFGDDKTDNAHDGDGSPGQLVSETIIPPSPDEYISKVEFFQNDVFVAQKAFPPFNFNVKSAQEGNYNLMAAAVTNLGNVVISDYLTLEVIPAAVQHSALQIELTNPQDELTLPAPAQISITAGVDGIIEPEPAHMLVSNTQTGYRKVKVGNNPTSIYSPKVDVVNGGNTTLEITMKQFSDYINWNKIRIRPEAQGNLNLKPYVELSGNDLSDWTTISIPLADFDPAIDFSQIAYFEFPYSADAGFFEIGIQKIEFTGGPSPYLWFGDDKLDNAHNGNGGGGELVATVVEASQEILDVQHIAFFMNGSKIYEAVSTPFQYELIIEEPGDYAFYAQVTDTDGLTATSDTNTITIEEFNPEQGIMLTVQLDDVPENLTVSKAKLKYNKDFAYSFTLDDGKIDAYTHAFQLFNGGYIEANSTYYPGLFYTDGCGNDIPFRGTLAWNSVNANYQDLHINTPDYITWTQLGEMYEAGWDVVNHSYSHAAYGNTDYNFEITQNREYVNQQAGIDMTHFVPPSGDEDYIQPAFELDNKVVYTRTNPYLGFKNGLPIDDPVNFEGLRIYRKLINDDDFTPDNVSRYLDDVADWSTNGNHYWWTEFTHRVRYKQTGASLVFPTFEYYMNYIEQTYGKSGSDRIWMAPLQEVYEYLLARDQTEISYVVVGSELKVFISNDKLPNDLRNYYLTLVIESDAEFSTTEIESGEVVSFNGTADQKLINITWDGSDSLKAGMDVAEGFAGDQAISPENTNQVLEIYPNPIAGNTFNFIWSTDEKQQARIFLFDTFGNIIMEQHITFDKGTREYSISLDRKIGPGIYFIRLLEADGNSTTRKVIIQ